MGKQIPGFRSDGAESCFAVGVGSEPCWDTNFIPLEHFVPVGGRGTMKDANGLSNAHHTQPAGNFVMLLVLPESCMDGSPSWQDGTESHTAMGGKTGDPAGRHGNGDRVCNPGTEVHVMGSTVAAIPS